MRVDLKSYLLKIKLLGVRPPVWRRFVVPKDIMLSQLHDVIQIVMGWTDSHLHQFLIDGKRYTKSPEWPIDGYEEKTYRLGSLVKGNGSTFQYRYDFGDEWRHDLIVEDDDYLLPEAAEVFTCLNGKRACPPEDVGGVYGYLELCEALQDPDHEERDHWVEWIGDDFDSEYFNLEEVNAQLKASLHEVEDVNSGFPSFHRK
jgi:hypothetical protein